MKIFYFVTGIIFLLWACSESPSEPPGEEGIPVIEEVRLSTRWNLADTAGLNLVEVKIRNTGGFDNLNNVLIRVLDNSEIIFTDSLYDDGGISGSTDVIAGDGVFRNLFSTSVISRQEGSYTFNFSITDTRGNKDSTDILVTFGFNSPPQISGINIPDSLRSGSNPVILNVFAQDIDGVVSDISVLMDIMQNNISILNEPYLLANDGEFETNGDAFANDTIFSLKIDSSFAAGRAGRYTLRFTAVDEFEDESNVITHDIFLENSAGRIISIDMPLVVTRPSNIPIRVLVTEPQGLDDVQRVFFELKDSAGNYIESFPGVRYQQDLYDDGDFDEHGDEQIDDAIFSIILRVDETNIAETYTLEFYLIDKVGNTSMINTSTLEIQ
jgi:hypothetical protein